MTGGYKILVFLFLSFWISTIQAQEYDFYLEWKGEEATSIVISEQEIPHLNVRLLGKAQKIAGSVIIDTNTCFTPYFPFSIGTTYQVFNGQKLLFTFSPDREIKAPEVQRVYPLAELLPENFLKFYIQFDQPMASGHVYKYLQLLEEGKPIENALIPLQPELWNADRTLLTVWIDPGRVKRDLGPNKKFGAVLKAGNTYHLQVNKGLKAANGSTLNQEFVKAFKVIKRDEEIPGIRNWIIHAPEKETTNPVKIDIKEPMDYSTQHFMEILNNGEKISGKYTFVSDTSIHFKPENVWSDGSYVLRVASKAEDLAGNNFNRPFDRDLEKLSKVSEQEYYEITFSIE
ncbi:hypothetical protein GCM10011506_22670 [Marivirga lumbricoides]|uniref:SbsA Ig-like domain-containing protein n=2 Tax=Marivirga lumbricoides TaxID=1046115 RepID=A0ABQ1M9K0_9BACT|nr:hypothetical protein GCM10011506_22670 [Marivirga lumbricoides]